MKYFSMFSGIGGIITNTFKYKYSLTTPMSTVTIPVQPETKEMFRKLSWPTYITTYEARVKFVIEHFNKLL